MGGSKFLDAGRWCAVDHFEGVEGSWHFVAEALRRVREPSGRAQASAARRNLSRLLHPARHGVLIQAEDGGALAPARHDANGWGVDRGPLAALRREPFRPRPIPDLGPERRGETGMILASIQDEH